MDTLPCTLLVMQGDGEADSPKPETRNPDPKPETWKPKARSQNPETEHSKPGTRKLGTGN